MVCKATKTRIKPRRVLLSTGAWGVSFLRVTCYIYIDEEFFDLALPCGNSFCFSSLLKGMFLNFPFEDARSTDVVDYKSNYPKIQIKF